MLEGLVKSFLGGGHSEQGQLMTMVAQLMTQNGGLNGLLEKFQTAGLGEAVQSWISTGQNLPLSSDDVMKVLGSPQIQGFATQLGLDSTKVSGLIAEHLPRVIDQLSPNGQLPDMSTMLGQIAGLKNLF